MEAAHISAPNSSAPKGAALTEDSAQRAPNDAHLRRCLVTGAMLSKAELLRFVVGPDQTLYPDLAENLPGRGLWVSISREAVTTAATKNLFAKAAKTKVTVAKDLADQVARLLHKRSLELLGLCKRASLVVPGQTEVEAHLKKGQLALLLLADDAKSNLSSYRASKDLPTFTCFNREELGASLGQVQLVYVGFKSHALTTKLLNILERLEKIAPMNHIDVVKDSRDQ